MLRATAGGVTAAIMTGLAALLVRSEYEQEGPVVLQLSQERGWGVHRGDVLVAVAWMTGMSALGVLVL